MCKMVFNRTDAYRIISLCYNTDCLSESLKNIQTIIIS